MLHYLQAFWKSCKTYLYTEVPPEVAACEFDCRELDCSTQTWEECLKRQQREQTVCQLRGID